MSRNLVSTVNMPLGITNLHTIWTFSYVAYVIRQSISRNMRLANKSEINRNPTAAAAVAFFGRFGLSRISLVYESQCVVYRFCVAGARPK